VDLGDRSPLLGSSGKAFSGGFGDGASRNWSILWCFKFWS